MYVYTYMYTHTNICRCKCIICICKESSRDLDSGVGDIKMIESVESQTYICMYIHICIHIYLWNHRHVRDKSQLERNTLTINFIHKGSSRHLDSGVDDVGKIECVEPQTCM